MVFKLRAAGLKRARVAGRPKFFLSRVPMDIASRPTLAEGYVIARPHAAPTTVSLMIDSRDRDYDLYPTPNAYVVRLPETLRRVTAARLVTAEIPSSFYVFTAARGNTSLTLSIAGTARTVTIPDGNYGFSGMAAALVTAINAAYSLSDVSVTFGPVTLRTAIATAAGAVTVDTTTAVLDKRTQWGLAFYLGFAKGVAAASGAASPRPAIMNPEGYIVLDIEQLGRVREPEIYGGGGFMGTPFAKIPMNVNSFQSMFLYSADASVITNHISPTIEKLDVLRIAFRFHDGTPVDFQYLEHSMTLELTVERVR